MQGFKVEKIRGDFKEESWKNSHVLFQKTIEKENSIKRLNQGIFPCERSKDKEGRGDEEIIVTSFPSFLSTKKFTISHKYQHKQILLFVFIRFWKRRTVYEWRVKAT